MNNFNSMWCIKCEKYSKGYDGKCKNNCDQEKQKEDDVKNE